MNDIIDWVLKNSYIILTAAIGFPLLYFYFRKLKSKKRNIESKCARCGDSLHNNFLVTTEGTICTNCYEITLRNQRIAYWFFIGMAIFGLACGILGIYSDYRHGYIVGWNYFKEIHPILSIGVLCFISMFFTLKNRRIKVINTSKESLEFGKTIEPLQPITGADPKSRAAQSTVMLTKRYKHTAFLIILILGAGVYFFLERPASHYTRIIPELSDSEIEISTVNLEPGQKIDITLDQFENHFLGFKTDANYVEFEEYLQKPYISVLFKESLLFGSVYGAGMNLTTPLLKQVTNIIEFPQKLDLTFLNSSQRNVKVLIYTK